MSQRRGRVPALVMHTRCLLAEWMGGRSFGPLVLIHPAQRGQQALLAHELEHCRQWWWLAAPAWLLAGLLALLQPPLAWPWSALLVAVGLVLQAPLYLLLRPYRMWAEVRAYQAGVALAADRAVAEERAATALASHYWLRIGHAEALAMLRAGRQPWWCYWFRPRSTPGEAGG